MPAEFTDYAAKLQEMEENNPGQFLLAEKFGKTIPGVKSKELLSAESYELAFDEGSQMPKELKKAMDKYV